MQDFHFGSREFVHCGNRTMYGAKWTFFWKEQSIFIHILGIPWLNSGFNVDLAYIFLLLFVHKHLERVAHR